MLIILYDVDMDYRQQLKNFTVDSIPNLDAAVLGALELFADIDLPILDLDKFKRPLVVGSGNAAATGRILFANKDAVFADESTYLSKLDAVSDIDGIVLLSASGSKHATQIAQVATARSMPVMLLTNTPNSPAAIKLDNTNSSVVVLPKNREPYTYNTSTYLGFILAATKEEPIEILKFIETELAQLQLDMLKDYDKFVLIVPPEFAEVLPMLDVKFTELFGRQIARDVKTSEYMLHATTVVPSEELFISFGVQNETWGQPDQRLHIPLPEKASYGAMMTVGYWLVGQIQKQHPDYFKQHIEAYTKHISDTFDLNIEPIVPASNS